MLLGVLSEGFQEALERSVPGSSPDRRHGRKALKSAAPCLQGCQACSKLFSSVIVDYFVDFLKAPRAPAAPPTRAPPSAKSGLLPPSWPPEPPLAAKLASKAAFCRHVGLFCVIVGLFLCLLAPPLASAASSWPSLDQFWAQVGPTWPHLGRPRVLLS